MVKIVDFHDIFLIKPEKFKEVLSIRGIYNKGYVKKTNGQVKKHRVQMTDTEIDYLNEKIKSMIDKDIYFSRHAQNNGITATLEQVIDVLNRESIKDYIVEYNETPFKGVIEHRVLIRDSKRVMVKYNEGKDNEFSALSNLCFVLCIDNGKIVTTYYNVDNDSHDTLNLYRYDKNLKIIK